MRRAVKSLAVLAYQVQRLVLPLAETLIEPESEPVSCHPTPYFHSAGLSTTLASSSVLCLDHPPSLFTSLLPLLSSAGGCCCSTAPQPPNIPSPKSSRLPSNIPLRTLPSRSDHDRDREYYQPTSYHDGRGDDSHHHRHPSFSLSGSESSWTDTGDIGEQHADDDPLRLQLGDEIEEQLLAGVQRRSAKHGKKVRIHAPDARAHDRSRSRDRVIIDKEAIEVPDVAYRTPSRAERCLGAIMSGHTGSIHGLTGKALMYATMRILGPLLTLNAC